MANFKDPFSCNYDVFSDERAPEDIALSLFASLGVVQDDDSQSTLPTECDLSAFEFNQRETLELPSVDHSLPVCAPRSALKKLLDVARDGYSTTVPYHTYTHAVDVIQAALTLMDGMPCFSVLDKFSIAVAAVMHDFGHPGLNNAFLAKTNDARVSEFGEASTLELFHLHNGVRVIRENMRDSAGIVAHLTQEQQAYLLVVLAETIKATDMAMHKNITDNFNERVKQGAFADMTNLSPADKLMLLRVVLKSADISNVGRPQACAVAWTERVATEFLEQGDREREAGVEVTPMFDRANFKSCAHLVSGFVDFVAKPMFESAAQVLPGARSFVENMTVNRQQWEDEKKQFDSENAAPASEPSVTPVTQCSNVCFYAHVALAVVAISYLVYRRSR